jgi:GWxTD domain-containing protein
MTNRLLPVGLVIAQALCTIRTGAQVSDAGSIFFDAVTFAAETTTASRLDLYLAVPATSVSFERDANGFTAHYRVHFEVTSGGRRVHDTTIERTTSTHSNDLPSAQRSSYDFFQHRLLLPPGAYEARADIIDPRSSFVATSNRSISVSDRRGEALALSGTLLVDKIREDSSGFVMTPRISDIISSDGDGCFLFFESYNGPTALDARLDVRFMAGSGAVAAERSVDRTLPPGRSQQWMRLDASGIGRGSYTIELRASRRDDTATALATSRRTIRVEGSGGLPSSDAELEERVTQLRLVANQEQIDRLNEATDAREKRRRYAELWAGMDPTPGTARNEAMEEYFARIDYAKEHFRSYAAGWMTDQGRVYVLYGPPDRIARDPFRSDSRRIETWHYYARGNLEISFEDESGFGDFRLVTPISPLEKYRYAGT